jgi:DNA-binding GntR family transcriptional regulator
LGVPAPLDPITHKSKADTVATRLRQMIASGRYQPGEKLIQGELAAVLGVSTMPVREALLRLSADGLVTSESNRRFAVASNTAEELRDTFWMYSLIQSELARRACLRADRRSLLKVLTERHTSYRDCIDDPDARASANWEFFKSINIAAGSPRLVLMLRSTLRFFPGITDATPGSPLLAARWQKELIRAVAKGDADRAAAASKKYAQEAGELYIKSRA